MPQPEKFGFQPVRKRQTPVDGQLNLFTGGKVVPLGQQSTFELALLLDGQNDVRAHEMYLKAVEELDSKPDAYCNLGILESNRNNHVQAIDYFTRCLADEPRHFEAHYNLANVFAEVGNWKLAKVHYQMALQLEPDYANGHFNLALALGMLQDFQGALTELAAYRMLTPGEDHTVADRLVTELQKSLRQ